MTKHTVESVMALGATWVMKAMSITSTSKLSHVADSKKALETALREALRAEYNRGIDAAAEISKPKYSATTIGVGQTYSGSIASCGCSTYTDSAGNVHAMQCQMHAILALKEQP